VTLINQSINQSISNLYSTEAQKVSNALERSVDTEQTEEFHVKVCLRIAMSWVCVFWLSDKTVRKFTEHILSATKFSTEAKHYSFWRYIKFYAVIHWEWGLRKMERQLSQLLFTKVYKINKIQNILK